MSHWLSPRLNPGPHGTELAPAALALRAEALVPYARTDRVYVGETGAAHIQMEPRPGAAPLDFETLVLDSVTGKELGRVQAHSPPASWADVMPFIYKLHYALALDKLGSLGVVALVWTIDCFVGFYLTLPAGRDGFWLRWKPAWRVKWSASAYRINFDLHRAGGLWLWAMLFQPELGLYGSEPSPVRFFPFRSQRTAFERAPEQPGVQLAGSARSR